MQWFYFFQGNHIILNIFLGSIHNFAIKILKMNSVTKLSPNQNPFEFSKDAHKSRRY